MGNPTQLAFIRKKKEKIIKTWIKFDSRPIFPFFKGRRKWTDRKVNLFCQIWKTKFALQCHEIDVIDVNVVHAAAPYQYDTKMCFYLEWNTQQIDCNMPERLRAKCV